MSRNFRKLKNLKFSESCDTWPCFVHPQVSQVAGLLTDNFALKRMYVASEALNLVGDLRVELTRGELLLIL